MSTAIVPRLHAIDAGNVNVFVLDAPEGLTLIDAGLSTSGGKIVEGIRSLGKSPADLRHILLTHAHPDHIGSLAALQAASGARTYLHVADVPVAETGGPFRRMQPSPELIGSLLFKMLVRSGASAKVAPTAIDERINDGDVLPIAGGIRVLHTPGHCAGHVAYLWQERGVLFVGDACKNLLGFSLSLGYEDLSRGRRSLRDLADHSFDTACFGHGKTMVGGAAERFRRRWA